MSEQTSVGPYDLRLYIELVIRVESGPAQLGPDIEKAEQLAQTVQPDSERAAQPDADDRFGLGPACDFDETGWDERFSRLLEKRDGKALIRPEKYVQLVKLLFDGDIHSRAVQIAASKAFNRMERTARQSSAGADLFRTIVGGRTSGHGFNGCAINLSRLYELIDDEDFADYLLGEEYFGVRGLENFRRFVRKCHEAGIV